MRKPGQNAEESEESVVVCVDTDTARAALVIEELSQKQAFGTAPTWGDFVEKTVSNTQMKLVAPSPKDGENPGCEVLWAPLSKLVPYTTGSRRVTVEMRRLGFNWVPALSFKRGGVTHPGWKEMTKKLFDLAKTLNR